MDILSPTTTIVLMLVILMEVRVLIFSVVHHVSMGLSILVWSSSVGSIVGTGLRTSHIGVLWLDFSLDLSTHVIDVKLIRGWSISVNNRLASAI